MYKRTRETLLFGVCVVFAGPTPAPCTRVSLVLSPALHLALLNRRSTSSRLWLVMVQPESSVCALSTLKLCVFFRALPRSRFSLIHVVVADVVSVRHAEMRWTAIYEQAADRLQ